MFNHFKKMLVVVFFAVCASASFGHLAINCKKQIIVIKRKKHRKQVAETSWDYKGPFCYMMKFLSFDWIFSGNFELRFVNFLCFEEEKVSFLTRKGNRQHSCRNTPIIWRNAALDCRISGNVYVRLVNVFLYFWWKSKNLEWNLRLLIKTVTVKNPPIH